VSRLSPTLRRHDPYWDMDGAGVQRRRTKRRVIRMAAWVVVVLALAFLATRLPSLDATYLLQGEGRPVMAAAMLGLLGSAAILALARVRNLSRD
jgi:molybdopterin/thiamine biosynthesis adenylyltransferase